MNLKQLIKEVEKLRKVATDTYDNFYLKGIKQTVEAVDKDTTGVMWDNMSEEYHKDWQKLKKLLEVK